MVGSLPYLSDVGLKRVKGQFQLVPGMDKVADLLMTAQVNIPALFRNWSIVSLARYEADGFIMVRSKEIKEIVFGTRDKVGDFRHQIALLDMVVSEGRIQAENPAVSVNLALGEMKGGAQVPVVFGTPTALPVGSGSNRSAPTRPPVEAPSARAAAPHPSLFTSITFPSREL
jgi:cell division protein FtsQ